MSKLVKDKNIVIPDNIIAKLLTHSELIMLKNRWQIIKLLEVGVSIRKIAKLVKVGSDTVVRVSKMMKQNNLHEYLTNNTKQSVKIRNQTSWVFGKSEKV